MSATPSANFFDDNDDLRWYVDRGVDWGALVRATEFRLGQDDAHADVAEAVDFYRAALEAAGSFAATEVAPHGAELDRQHPVLVDGEVALPPRQQAIFDALRDLELHGLCVPRELGGSNAPLLVSMLNTELFARADVSVTAHHGFHGGIAMALLVYSLLEGSAEVDTERRVLVRTRFDEAIREIVSGQAWGSMDLTEPDAGSDLGALRTRAVPQPDGTWRVTGQKVFITSGHGRWHVVIARTEAARDTYAGLDGLSLFVVPAWSDGPEGRRRHVQVSRVEDKLGHRASATVTLDFDEAPALLVGARGEGFRQMLLLMNGARIGVGFEAVGLAEAAWRQARAYAAQRRSMGRTIDRHPRVAELLEGMQTEIQGLRALAVHAAWCEELAQKARLWEEVLKAPAPLPTGWTAAALRRESRRLTPLLKWAAGERAVAIARDALQVHGGAGYTTEYPAEKLLRDALVLPIYEGTSQIQALMATKDALLGAIRRPQAFLRDAAEASARSLSARDPLEKATWHLAALAFRAERSLLTRIAADKLALASKLPISQWRRTFTDDWDPSRDLAPALLHCERLTLLLADAAIASQLWQQARLHPERREVLERFVELAEPRCHAALLGIQRGGERLLRKLGEADRVAAVAS